MRSRIIYTEIVDPTWGTYMQRTDKLVDIAQAEALAFALIDLCNRARIKGQIGHVHVYRCNLPAVINDAFDYSLDELQGMWSSLPTVEVWLDGEPPAWPDSDFRTIDLGEIFG